MCNKKRKIILNSDMDFANYGKLRSKGVSSKEAIKRLKKIVK